MNLVIRFFGLLVLLVGLASCDRIKSRVDAIMQRTQNIEAKKAPESDHQLSAEEVAMNKMLQDPKLFDASSAEPDVPTAPVVEINKAATVSILGYHDFRERGGTSMLIAGPKFRQQMQAIKDSKIPVITMSDVLAWKRGEKDVPEESIVITIDDGWRGVYEIAYPILKEFKFPFTIYLYKNYVNSGGRSMTWEMIKEMMANGCEVGSHTVTHDPLTNRRKLPEGEYQLKLLKELRDSREFLEQNLATKIAHIAYPYGTLDETVVTTTLQVGYEAGVTVSPQKTSWDTPNGRLPRYIVHGDEDSIFRNATTFRSRGQIANAKSIDVTEKSADGEALVFLQPVASSTISDRRPVITANLIKLGSIVPESIKMRVAGFGVVPHNFDPKTFIISYQPPTKLRRENCVVTITFKRNTGQPEEVVSWRFGVDLAAAYLPTVVATPPPADLVPAEVLKAQPHLSN
jgi:peptidoglycan/xylan/chitin deacetylase (PgdA/CDA1 family)